jgi:hypothetical protein
MVESVIGVVWKETVMARIVMALALLLAFIAPAYADCDHPSAIERAAAVATCMTDSRRYPPGGGVVATGLVSEAMLFEEGETFARYTQQERDGPVELETLDVPDSLNGPAYNRERERDLLACHAATAHGQP